ncbi:MAG: tubulin-like doman-containing protein [Planctomyces sp.]
MSNTEILTTAVISDRAPARSPISSEPVNIAGYDLRERIGVGGYGEVWKAVGPGGFLKAVKILYGQIDGPQAETELKSLNLMRELRHPFLLNVERVEFVNGRVVVVTELADKSLDLRFEEVVRSGARGVPREELLGYLRDAADALDFMSETHGLQHLDIKPENILIQGAHAKVGDFGLTKSVAMTRASLINGFTPVYAPPELFDGQASANSDQYSLAIVYQVMLTGVQPFNGRTAAQLASQHLKGTPDLSALPAADRGVIARALSKNPNTRFSGCRQFIEELSRRRQSNAATSRPKAAASQAAPQATGLTQVLNPAVLGKSTSTPLKLARPAAAPPASSTATEAVSFRPTVVISAGGLGARVLREMRQSLLDQFGGKCLPSVEFLCLDADKDGINQIRQADSAAGITPVRTLLMPLRSAQEYRKTSAEHLQWLSRRWLFNIPRSGNVEGMRPLGRLAFLDNQQRIQEAIQELVSRVTSAQSVRESSTLSGLAFQSSEVDVLLIGSASGGTSSGSLIDLGVLLRSLVRKMKFASTDVSAILLHGTSAGRQNSDTQDANTVSLLQELQHHCLLSDQSATRRGNDLAGPPFDTTWFLHLGDDLSSVDYSRQAASIGSYFSQTIATDRRRILRNWLEAEKQNLNGDNGLKLRTMGSASIYGTAWVTATSHAEQLVGQLLAFWLSEMARSGKGAEDRMTRESRFGRETLDELDQLLDGMMLSSRRIGEFVPSLLRGEIGRRIEAYTADVWKRVTQSTTRISDLGELVNTLANTIGADTGPDSNAPDSVARITQTVRQDLAARQQQAALRLRQKIQQDLDGPHRIALARLTIETLLAAVDQAVHSCATQKEDVQRAFADLCSSYMKSAESSPGSISQGSSREFCQQYCMLLVCQTVCQCTAGYLAGLKDSLSKSANELVNGSLVQIQQMAADIEKRNKCLSPLPAPVIRAFDSLCAATGPFQMSALAKGGEQPAKMLAALTSSAYHFLMAQGDPAASSGAGGEANQHEAPGNFPANAHPFLSSVGGFRRVLAVVPRNTDEATWRNRFEAEFGQCVTILHSEQTEITACCEVEGILAPDVIDSLTNLRPRVAEIAQRVHTRTDIAW